MSDSKRPGEKGRSILQEVFGTMPFPAGKGSFDLDYNDYWRDRLTTSVVLEPTLRRARFIERFLDASDSVLDIGCGTGETLEHLREARSIDGTGLDISMTALEKVSAKGFQTICLNLTEPTSSLECQYDHIILFGVAEHVHNTETLMLNLRGRFKKGLYVAIPNLGYIAHRLRMLFGRFPLTYITDVREHIRYWTVRDFLDWTDWLGFEKPEVIGVRGKVDLLSAPRRWPSLWASDVIFRFPPS